MRSSSLPHWESSKKEKILMSDQLEHSTSMQVTLIKKFTDITKPKSTPLNLKITIYLPHDSLKFLLNPNHLISWRQLLQYFLINQTETEKIYFLLKTETNSMSQEKQKNRTLIKRALFLPRCGRSGLSSFLTYNTFWLQRKHFACGLPLRFSCLKQLLNLRL